MSWHEKEYAFLQLEEHEPVTNHEEQEPEIERAEKIK